MAILSLYAAATSCKKLETYHISIFHAIEKPNSRSIQGGREGALFIPKLQNKIISPNYQFSYCCNFVQKIRYIDLHGFVTQLNKLVLRSFLSNKPSSISPHKKSFKSILSLYAAVTSSNNFSQNLKKPQKPNLDPLQPERPQNKVFPENI